MNASGQSEPGTSTSQLSKRHVQCSVPGCGKLFNRKEHLTRHLKSHDPQRHYACHMCGRKYARSDVLKRHVEHHPKAMNFARTLNACTSCHQRKLKCDDNVPCQSCIRNSTECTRVARNGESGTRTRHGINDEPENDMTNGDEQTPTSEYSNNIELSCPTPNDDHHIIWYQNTNRNAPSPTSPLPARLDAPRQNGSDANEIVQWTSNFGTLHEIDETIAAATPKDLSFASQLTKSPCVESLPNRLQQTIDQSTINKSTLNPKSASSPKSFQEDFVTNLHVYLLKDPLSTERLVQIFFAEIHDYWPILHAPTFEIANASPVLLGAMILLAYLAEGEADHIGLASLVFNATNGVLQESNPLFGDNIDPISLQTLQAVLLCVVYSACSLTNKSMSAKAVHLNRVLISSCRNLGIFNGQHAYHDAGGSPFAFWKIQEEVHRLAFSALRIDAYLSVLIDQPPSVRYQELAIPLPKSPILWAATTEDERRRLQWNEPAGREKAVLCLIMRDALDYDRRHHLPCHLTEVDYHLGLCALQGGTWEAAHEAHGCESDELVTNPSPKDPIQLWRTHLGLWRASMELDCQLRQKFFFPNPDQIDCVFAPLTLILWHMSAIILHTPLKLLQGKGCCFRCHPGTAIAAAKRTARIRFWLATSCPRAAIWNAAQICRIVDHKSARFKGSTRLLLNPLAVPGILKSGIVACSYASHTCACATCTGSPPEDAIDLFNTEDENSRLVQWKEQGVGFATWGPSGIPVCQCQLSALATWFCEALERDRGAKIEFNLFMNTLRK